eukprot:2294720-Rhodomonas_salina.2
MSHTLAHEIPKARMNLLCREIMEENGNYKMQNEAIETLHRAAEEYLGDVFKYSNEVGSVGKRCELRVQHMQCAESIMKQVESRYFVPQQ